MDFMMVKPTLFEWLKEWSPLFSLIMVVFIAWYLRGIEKRQRRKEKRIQSLNEILAWTEEVYKVIDNTDLKGLGSDIMELVGGALSTRCQSIFTTMFNNLMANQRKATILQKSIKNRWPDIASLFKEWIKSAESLSNIVESGTSNFDGSLNVLPELHYQRTIEPTVELRDKTQDIHNKTIKTIVEYLSRE